MIKVSALACGLFALTACDVKAAPSARADAIYAEQPKGDQGVPGRCARIVNPEERRKCILSAG